MAAIFVLDLRTPLGLNVPMLYVVPTFIFVWAGSAREPLVVAALATVLTVAGFYVSPEGGSPDVGVFNRVVSVLVTWVVASLVVARLRGVERWSAEVAGSHRALQESIARLQDLRYALDQSAIVAATDQRGLITYVNDKFCEISQYSREELLGRDHRIINSKYHSKDFIRNLWTTIARGGVWRGEIRNRRKDGSFYWVDTTIVPFLNERGKPWQYLSIRYDITQRKAAEEQLRDEAALTKLGRLSAVVAHEVRNPLAALKGSLQVLAGRIPADVPGRDIIAPMLARIDALNRTVEDILTYARPAVPKVQRFELGPLLADAASSARAAVPGSPIAINGDQVVLDADPEMCRAVFLNLLLNACQAGDSQVDVTVSAHGAVCEVGVADRGAGVPREVREHLFEPFVTTKSGGTGLGLPIARRLAQLQGGTLTLHEREGGGTVARVTLPLRDAHAARAAEERATAS
jgi:PAS domain S-box-containing protein